MKKFGKAISAQGGSDDVIECGEFVDNNVFDHLSGEVPVHELELHAYQDALVRTGLDDFRKGRVIPHEQVVARLKKTGRAYR